MVEAANGPTTPGGDAVLRERGIEVLPDIYTNGGARLRYAAWSTAILWHTQVAHRRACPVTSPEHQLSGAMMGLTRLRAC